MKKVLTIAGSDCSGGAGAEADIKTISAHGMYAMSVITALTAQNTTGVFAVNEISPEFTAKQLDCIFSDIRPDSVKIGMVYDAGTVRVIAEKLRQYNAENIVIDTVMVSSSGTSLLTEEAKMVLINTLLPIADLITPNIPEAEVLCGFSIKTEADMRRAAEAISKSINGAVLIKGGHLDGEAADMLYSGGSFTRFVSDRINTKNSHGTGCTLSSAIACGLAAGKSLNESVRAAKEYLTKALSASLDIGKGSGPLNHLFALGNIDKTDTR